MDQLKIEPTQELIPVTENEQNEVVVSGRDLHEFLEIGTEYKKWMSRMIEYGFEENIDYARVSQKSLTLGGAQNITEHILKLDAAKAFCSINSRSKKSRELYDYLLKQEGKEVFVHKQPRKEYIFSEMLEQVTGLEWIEQYRVFSGRYRIDYYNPEYNIAVEYDEKHHDYNKDSDIFRQKEIEKELGCHFFRVKEDEELQGINKIIRTIYQK